MNEIDFEVAFRNLTGNPPLSWQMRLYERHFANNKPPSVIDLPTGLGKTMIIAIWLIARARKRAVPTRLIYVVDRRTVVDQATDLAKTLVKNWNETGIFEGGPPAISTLRGQLADNREWSRDPSKPAIIIGTVDLIGSALLFSGYRSGFKQRPLHAGLLGQESLLVLDEAHLSKPFEKLITSISRFQDGQGAPTKVIRMSATTAGEDTTQFKLEDADLSDPIIKERFEATKRLMITKVGEKEKLNDKLVAAAIKLATDDSVVGKRIVVFVSKPDHARGIAESIRKHEAAKNKPGLYADSVEVLTGTMRGLERDELVKKCVFRERWLNGKIHPADESNKIPAFLISTSAGEVGFDLNADHLVCDAAPLDSMIQRLGRVNRRGKGDATILLFHESIEPTGKDGELRELEGLEKSIATTLELLKDVTDVSPKNIAASKNLDEWKKGEGNGKSKYEHACSPEPTMVELTDILLDSWSMTSITTPIPGRPEVAPWIRGIANDLPQTTIAWRAELDLFKDEPKPEKAFKAIFAKHRIRSHESLTTNSYNVVAFLNGIKKKRPELLDKRVVVKFSRNLIVTTIGKLIDDPGPLNADPTLILPATFGGLDKGMLSHESIPPAPKPDDPPPPSLDVADEPGYEPREDARARLRILIERTDDGNWKALPLSGGATIPGDLKLDSIYETSTRLFNAFKDAEFCVRLVQPVAFDEEDKSIRSLVALCAGVERQRQSRTNFDQTRLCG